MGETTISRLVDKVNELSDYGKEMRNRIAAKDAEIAELRKELGRANFLCDSFRDDCTFLEFERDEARECVRRLQRSAQDVLDRWNSPKWQWHNQGPTADLMNALRDTLAATPEHLR